MAAPPRTPPTPFTPQFLLLIVTILILIFRVSYGSQSPPPPPVVSRIAFGSCSNQSAPQPIWDAILDFDPEVFIWLGDNVYGDNRRPWRLFGKERTIGPWKNVHRFFPSTQQELKDKYDKAKANPRYSMLRNRAKPIWDAILDFDPEVFIWLGDNVYGDNRRPWRLFGKERTIGPWKNVHRFFPSTQQELKDKYDKAKAKANPRYSMLRNRAKVIGTWDDHDYGLNDAGKEFIGKDTNQRLLLDFLDEPADSPRRKQAGVYTSYVFGPKGKQIKVILLDTRYHRDPLYSDGTILGESQWEWLEKELNGPESQITIIASSIQVISNISAATGLFHMESWGRFPKERDRLYKLIADSKRSGVFFISGDVHFGEITRYDCGCKYPLYDITSSGLTQAVEKAVHPLFAILVRVAAWLTPSTMRVYSPNCRYRTCTYGQQNFGAIEIEWDTVPQIVKIEVRDVHGEPAIGMELLLSELQPSNNTYARGDSYRQHCTLETDLPWFLRHRLAFIFWGTVIAVFVALVLLIKIIASFSQRFIRKYKID